MPRKKSWSYSGLYKPWYVPFLTVAVGLDVVDVWWIAGSQWWLAREALTETKASNEQTAKVLTREAIL